MTKPLPLFEASLPTPPPNMTQVGHDDFWAAIMAEKRDIHPSSERYCTNWMFAHSHQLWGWTSKGYLRNVDRREEFWLARPPTPSGTAPQEVGK
jgi:hypothetical protein